MKLNTRQLAFISITALVASLGLAADLHAKTYNLRADSTTITMPDGTVVPVWGFADMDGGNTVKLPGPTLDLPAADTNLTINLTNNLPVPVSIYIPGLRLPPSPTSQGGRVMSFTAQAAAATAGGPGSATFTFTGLKPGTFIYQSGTNPATQIPMGLYGAVISRPAAANQAYNDAASAYDNEQTVVFSEIDPDFNTYVGSTGTAIDPNPAKPKNYALSYAPKYFLFNGKTFPDSASPAMQLTAPPGKKTLLRLINAGSQNHVPTIAGLPVKTIGEDGNYLTYARNELAPVMAAGKTLDVILDLSATPPTEPNFFTMFDRRNNRASSAGTTGAMFGFISSFPPGMNCSPFKGDMNADNKIDMVDVLILLNSYVNSIYNANGDVDVLPAFNNLPCGNGTLELSDAIYVLRKALGIN